jgi:chlorite dismutase
MNHTTEIEVSLIPLEGWHRFDRAIFQQFSPADRQQGAVELAAMLDPAGPQATARLQTSVVSGHKADFGLMVLDPDPLKIDAVHQRVLFGKLGPAIVPTYSFVSMTEVSEYVPTVEAYGKRLIEEGEQLDSPSYRA